MTNRLFITVAGNIGTGKTTLTTMLAQHFGWHPHFESVSDNPYLSDFYTDMARWSFPLQVYFLNHRYKAHKSITSGSSSAIQDRSIYEDANIFARNLFDNQKMESRDYYNYLDLYNEMTKMLPTPDLMIYLRKSVPRLVEQIKLRGRDYEQSIPIDYLTSLNQYYDEWIENYSNGRVLVIESDDLDFVKNPSDFNFITKKVIEQLDQKDLILQRAQTEGCLHV